MSTVLRAIEADRAVDRLKVITQEAAKTRGGVHWRYDLLSSRNFPAQYFAVAQRGSGPDCEDLLVIAVECFYDESAQRFVVSASIAEENGSILAEANPTTIDASTPIANGADPARAAAVIQRIQKAFDRKVDWVNDQAPTIYAALA